MRQFEISLLLSLIVPMAQADEPGFRQRAAIEITRPGTFVQLPLPVAAYGATRQPGLADLRVVDARGERVPFAVLAPRVRSQTTEAQRDAALFPLPPRNDAAAIPWQVTVRGDVVQVDRQTASSRDTTRAAGWLVDTGPRVDGAPPATALRLQWPGTAEFSAPFDWETSDDLRSWRAGGSGQLMALVSPGGTLKQGTLRQDVLPIGPGTGRFVRLYWTDPSTAPALDKSVVIANQQRDVAIDPPARIALTPTRPTPDPADRDAPRALEVDLGGVVPLIDVSLRWTTGNRVAPLRILGRSRANQAWQPLTQGVAYRLERDGRSSESPALALQAEARYLRLVPDERSGAIDAAGTQVVVQAALSSLVFAAQGTAPYALMAGSTTATAGALPVASLVPALDDERPRFGAASLGAFVDDAKVVTADREAAERAAWRPLVLWAVLLVGVAGLGAMVFRLVRKG